MACNDNDPECCAPVVPDGPAIDAAPPGEAEPLITPADPSRAARQASWPRERGCGPKAAARRRRRRAVPAEPHIDLLESAWGVIANAGWDDCAKTPGWQEAAERWRDGYRRWLDLHLRPGGYQTWEELAVSVTRERDALFAEVAGLRRAAQDADGEVPALPLGDAFDPAEYWHKQWEAALERADKDGAQIISQHVRIGELERRAEAAEGKLAAIKARLQEEPRERLWLVAEQLAADILAIIGTGEGGAPDDRSFMDPAL